MPDASGAWCLRRCGVGAAPRGRVSEVTALEDALAVFYTAEPERARRALVQHALGPAGVCPICRRGEVCVVRATAERALALRQAGGAR